MFKHCLSKFSCALVLMCALVTGGMLQSCVDLDDYKYDDSEPSWLGSSIYDFLNEGAGGHTYQEYVKIIEALGLKDVLARTGSKTLFIADDAAFAEFYANNDWGVREFDDLSDAQLKVILYNSMLDNAYLLDMLSNKKGETLTEGSCLRRPTSAAMMDTVATFTDAADTPNGFRLPQNNKFFDRFREVNGGKGMRVVMGQSDPVMVHFLSEFVAAKHIEDTDFDIFFNHKKTRTGTEALVFDKKIVTSGVEYDKYSDDTLTITCKNGYLYRMDGVLVPPSDMAQELRKHPDTKLFSRMIDRFAYPLWGELVTTDGKTLQNLFDDSYNRANEAAGKDKEYVHVIKYSVTDASEFKDYVDYEAGVYNDETFNGATLNFDPGYAQYGFSDGVAGDMAAMLVPNDEMVYRFFAPFSAQPSINPDDLTEEQKEVYGIGASIVERYAKPEDVAALTESDYQTIAPCLDSIPLDIIEAFLDNLMQTSLLGTLPSNFDKVANDARDPMGLKPSDVAECVVANNGIIYILNNVFGPARYQAVMTPPLIMQNMRIMDKIIEDLGYDSYLLAMDSYFSFIVPDDEYFVYYDPVSLSSSEPLAWVFKYGRKTANQKEDGMWAEQYRYNPDTYEIDTTEVVKEIAPVLASKKFTETSDMGNRLHDLMEYLIIVGDVEDGNQYYLTKGYGTVKCDVTPGADGEPTVKFYGGEQVEMSLKDGGFPGVAVKQRFIEKNGITYCTMPADTTPGSGHGYKSGVVSPPTTSINAHMSKNAEGDGKFKEFYEICNIVDDELLKMVFPLADVEDVSTDSLKKYSIFYNHKTRSEVSADFIVPFFSTYHYSVYVPTNEAVLKAYELGLPTREDIMNEIAAGNEGRAASIIRMLNKFTRYHFQDNAVYVDKLPFSIISAGEKLTKVNYETAAIDDATGRFFETTIETQSGKYGPTISITDQQGRTAKVINTPGEEGTTWNILSRDLYLKGADPSTATQITTSSFAVIHQIDSVLYNSGILGFDGKFRRYANDGELVEQMNIDGETYLVGYSGSKMYKEKSYSVVKNNLGDTLKNSLGEDSIRVQINDVYKRTACIMQPSANKTKLSEEEYVYRAGTDKKIYITGDGELIDSLGNYIWTDGTVLSLDSTNCVAYPDSIVKIDKNGNPK